MGDSLLESFQGGFQDFLSSTKQLEGILSNALQEESSPENQEAIGQFLELFRKTQNEFEKELPGGVEQVVSDFRQGEENLKAHMAEANRLSGKLDDFQVRVEKMLQQAESTRAERALAPKPPSPADLARQRLAAMARRHGVEKQPNGILPALRDGALLQQKLLGILQPKPDPQVARAKAIGNIWDNWPAAAVTEPAEPESEDGQP